MSIKSSLIAVFIPLLIALSSFISCADRPTWSVQSHSPDDWWTAQAYTVEYGGFGTAGVETIVQVTRRKTGWFAETPQRILGFADSGPDMRLQMNWANPSQLIVTFTGDPKLLYYQVVKTSGINICVKNLAPDGSHAFRPKVKP